MRAKVCVVVAQVRGEAIDSNVLLPVVSFDGYELPAFVGQDERIFEGARA